ncbi:MAG: putative cobaltochelatase [Thermodesulfobacteriota bacterium]|nr:MAG: putative cobaltochelatase [Thermodesulfobacteriota bacterium]
MFKKIYPFAAIVGQEELKLALLLNAVNPKIGGVLIRGEKGTAKSTTVRALAALLPEIRVVAGCPYFCDPDDEDGMCERCKGKAPVREIRRRRIRVLTLPLNATEDRVAGGIDFSLAVKEGKRAVLPGLLAEANRSILYVDEVNLLDDHIVDIILDAAASGENRIEREGISFRHPASFILVGTMNPEEGELRPQFLDRFGLCVDIEAETDIEQRVELMKRRESFDLDPKEFLKGFEKENARTSERILSARDHLNAVRLPKHLRTFISELCTKNLVAGHRADLVMEQAARAHAALRQRFEVTTDDIAKVAPFVIVHRRRDAAPPPQPDQPKEEPPEDKNKSEQDPPPETEKPDNRPDAQPEAVTGEGSRPSGDQPGDADKTDSVEQPDEKISPEQIFEVGSTFAVKKIVSPRDRIYRRGSGRRSRTRVSLKQGRYIKSMPGSRSGDIALDATLRAAAPYQLKRKRENGLAVVLKKEDIREKIREKRIGNFLLFVVDASGSMGARGRMAASKGAIMSLLLDAYQKRDKVAMISFRQNGADLNLPPTSSVEMAGKLLAEMPVGGRTPLSAGLAAAHEQVRNHLLRDPAARPIVVIITDGKSNVAMGDQKPVEESFDFAAKMAADPRVIYIVVDTEETGLVTFGLAEQLARVFNARYFKIEELKADQLVNIVKERR